MGDFDDDFLSNLMGDAQAGMQGAYWMCACQPNVQKKDALAALEARIPQFSPLIPVGIQKSRGGGGKGCWEVTYYVNSPERGTNLQGHAGEGPQLCKDGVHFYKEASIINPTGCLLLGETGSRLAMVTQTALELVDEEEFENLAEHLRFRTNQHMFRRIPTQTREYPVAKHVTVCAHCRSTRFSSTSRKRPRRKRGMESVY